MKTLIQNRYFYFKKFFLLLVFGFLFSLITLFSSEVSFGGLICQDFEGEYIGWPGSDCELRRSTENVHSGKYSGRIDCMEFWNYVFIQYKGGTWHTDLLQKNNDRLIFWIMALPEGDGEGTDNNVGVKFYDHGNYHENGFEVWTAHKAHYGEWTKLTILFDQLPDDLDLYDIDKLEFKNYWPGTYYLDDIQAVRENRFYQSFEPDLEEYAWCWGGTCSLSELEEPVYEGQYSWKCVLSEYWAGTGIKSEQKYLTPRVATGIQSFCHVDLDPEVNDHLSFWVYALPINGLDTNVNVQFFDHGAHHTDETKAEYWTKKAAIYGKWTQITVPFSDVLKIAPDLNLNDIDKIQFQMYWPGTYYIDKIEATSSVPKWDRSSLRKGTLKWESNLPLNQYRLEENTTGNLKEEHWVDVYEGTGTSFTVSRISSVWYRVRAEEVKDFENEAPFVSSWSEVLEYNPPAVVINKSKLMKELKLEWTQLAQVTSYEVKGFTNPDGPWELIYQGPYPAEPITASENTWYRVRAVAGTETTDWSPPQWKPNPIEQDFLRAYGTTIRKGSETGDIVTLRGVNLGGYFIIELWINNWCAVNPLDIIKDDYSIREEGYDELIRTYRNSFIKEVDFDILMRMGVSLIRLPISYLDLQDENGNLIPSGFEKIDWVVNACADRGMYVLLDLHCAPGSQNRKDHSCRKDFNKLFEDSPEGEKYRNRTVALWKAIADHYKDNTTVMGYDLLNEPTGVIKDANRADSGKPNDEEKEKLWDFYDRLYQGIRSIDSRHIIMMEGIWDCNTLPNSRVYKWENVVYQFHYYLWKDIEYDLDSYIRAHKDFIDKEIDKANTCQDEYQIPFMVGEFNAFDARENWEYYLVKFNEQNWSWTLWTYKVSLPTPNPPWGLLTDQSYDEDDLPKFIEDGYEELEQKLVQYDTLSRYYPNYSLVGVVENYLGEGHCDIKANGSDGPITITPGDNFSLTVKLDPGILLGDNADWWLAADTPCGVYFYTVEGWTTDLVPGYQGPLIYLDSFELFRVPASGLPSGRYTMYFGIDTNIDGDVTWDSLYCDSVVVDITN